MFNFQLRFSTYLLQYLPEVNRNPYNLRVKSAVYQSATRTVRYQNSFFPFCNSHWYDLDCRLRNLPSVSSFKRAILKFFRPSPAPIFGLSLSREITLLTRLRVGFSHLREHKFRHGFLDTLDPFCSCRTNSIETTQHFLLECPNHAAYRLVLFDNIRNIDVMLFPLNPSMFCRILLFGNSTYEFNINQSILRAVVTFISATGRFDGSLYEKP